MSIWMRESTPAHAKAAPPSSSGYSYGGGPAWSDASRFRAAPTPFDLAESYKSLIYACCKLNYQARSRLILRLYVITGSGQRRPKSYIATKQLSPVVKNRLRTLPHVAKMVAGAEELEEVTAGHPLLKAVYHGNDDLDLAAMLAYTSMCTDVNGNAYWWPDQGEGSIPDEFWVLPPHFVLPVWRAASMVPETFYFGGVEYGRKSLIRFRELSMKNPYGLGMSPTQAAIEYARLEDSFVAIQDQLLQNGPRPNVIVSHRDPKGAFGDAERKRLDHELNQKARGGRAGSAIIVDGAAAITPVSWQPADLGTKEISIYDMERTANCFGVPISMLTNESSNRAVSEAGLVQHARNAVEPWGRMFASELTRWTHRLGERISRAFGESLNYDRLFWAFDPSIPEDKAAEAELHKTYFAMGRPLNKILTEAGYDPVEGGDVSLVPSGLQTLESVVNPPEPPTPPGGKTGDEDEDEPTPDEEEQGEDDPEDDPEPDGADESKSLDDPAEAVLTGVLESIHGKFLKLGYDDEADRIGLLLGKAPCRDENGRFASCGGASSAKPAKPSKKPAAKPAKKPGATTAKPKEPKPKPAKPDKPAAKPKEPKPAKEPKPKEPKKPAAKPAEAKPKPAPKPKPEAKPKPAEKPAKPPKESKPKPENMESKKPKPKIETPKEDAARHAEVLKQRHEAVDRRLANASHEIAAADKVVAQAKQKHDQARTDADRDAAQKELQTAHDRRDALHDELRRVGEWKELVKTNPGLIPPGHIKDRIAQDYESDAKVKAIAELGSDLNKLQQHHDALKSEYDVLSEKFRASGHRASASLANRLGQVMDRELPAAAKALQKSRDAVRAEATRILAAKNPLPIKADVSGPGFHEGSKAEIAAAHNWLSKVTEKGNAASFAIEVQPIPEGKMQRAYYNRDTNHIGLSRKGDGTHTVVHEFGHGFDHRLSEGSQNSLKRSLEFLQHRVGDEPLTPMSKFGEGYGPGEFGRKDDFGKAFGEHGAYYVGKDYKGRGTEVLAMGVEKLYSDPSGFAKADPEYASWVVGMLGGRLR